jgi:hypothetical protein
MAEDERSRGVRREGKTLRVVVDVVLPHLDRRVLFRRRSLGAENHADGGGAGI